MPYGRHLTLRKQWSHLAAPLEKSRVVICYADCVLVSTKCGGAFTTYQHNLCATTGAAPDPHAWANRLYKCPRYDPTSQDSPGGGTPRLKWRASQRLVPFFEINGHHRNMATERPHSMSQGLSPLPWSAAPGVHQRPSLSPKHGLSEMCVQDDDTLVSRAGSSIAEGNSSRRRPKYGE